MTNDLDTYVSIEDLLKATFRVTAVDTNIDHRREEEDVGRYMYTPQLAHLLLVTLKTQERNDNNEAAEESKIEAVEEFEELKTEAVEESKID